MLDEEDVMDQQDEKYLNWLMKHPLAALAWSHEIIAGRGRADADASEVEIALSCLVSTPVDPGSWSKDEWGALHRGRMDILSNKLLAPKFIEALCDCFEQEAPWQKTEYHQVGVGAWLQFFEKAADYGVGEETLEAVAQRAIRSPAMRAFLDSLPDESVAELFRLNARSIEMQASAWRLELAGRLSAAAAFDLLKKTCFVSAGLKLSNPLNGIDAESVRVMARTALADPVMAYGLVRSALFSLSAERPDGADSLAILLGEFAENPGLAMEKPGGSVEKVFRGSHGPLSLAMQMVCRNRPEAALAAARWAVALGGKGRAPQESRSDGIATAKFNMSISPFGGSSSIPVASLGEAALLLCNKELMLNFSGIGFPLPKKERAQELAARATSLAGSLPGRVREEQLAKGRDVKAHGAKMIALWEEVEIVKMLGRVKSQSPNVEAASPAKSRVLRM